MPFSIKMNCFQSGRKNTVRVARIADTHSNTVEHNGENLMQSNCGGSDDYTYNDIYYGPRQ